MGNDFVIPSSPLPTAVITISVGEIFAPSLLSKLNSMREWIANDEGVAFSNETINRVSMFFANHRRQIANFDASAGFDGSIGVLYRSNSAELYADFLANGRIRVFTQNATGARNKYITNSADDVSNTLNAIAPIFEQLTSASFFVTSYFLSYSPLGPGSSVTTLVPNPS